MAKAQKSTKLIDQVWYRKCNWCHEWKPLDTYARRAIKDRDRPDEFHRQYRCKECRRAEHLQRKYGLTVEQALGMGNKCEICGSIEQLNIDHSHDKGRVRGLLCGRCNRGLGHFEDDIDRLKRAIEYLSK